MGYPHPKAVCGYMRQKILFFGSSLENKGLGVLIEALVHLDHKNSVLTVITRDDSKKVYTVPQEIQDRIVFICKPLPNIERYVKEADIVVLPYKDLVGTEGNPSCLLEAMAAKKPVVTTDLPELREIVKKDKHVLMAKPKDSISLAEEIDRLLSSSALRKKIAAAAYKKSKDFDLKKVIKEYLRIYNTEKKLNIALLPATFTNKYSESSHITLLLLAKELKKHKHNPYIISEGDKRFPPHSHFRGIPIHRGPILPRFINKILSPIIALKKQGTKFDIIHSFSSSKILLLKTFLAKVILRTTAVHTLKSYSRSKLDRHLDFLLNLADIVIVPTNVFARSLVGVNRNKIKTIRSFIDHERFSR